MSSLHEQELRSDAEEVAHVVAARQALRDAETRVWVVTEVQWKYIYGVSTSTGNNRGLAVGRRPLRAFFFEDRASERQRELTLQRLPDLMLGQYWPEDWSTSRLFAFFRAWHDFSGTSGIARHPRGLDEWELEGLPISSGLSPSCYELLAKDVGDILFPIEEVVVE